MSGLFGGGSSASAPPPPPPMPVLQPPAPMPIPDRDEERRAAFKEMMAARAGKTTRMDTIIGGFNNDDKLGT